jgi:hypothetical protein
MRRHPSNPKAGAVYVLSNEAMPGLVKIGRTRNPKGRLAQINSYLGDHPDLPAFVLEAHAWSSDYVKAEWKMHALFDDRRIHPLKELFEVPVEEAVAALSLVVAKTVSREQVWPFPERHLSTPGRKGKYQGSGAAFEWMRQHYGEMHDRVGAPGFEWGLLSYEIAAAGVKAGRRFLPLAPHVLKQIWPKVQRAVFYGVPYGDTAGHGPRQARQTCGPSSAPGAGDQRERPGEKVEPLPLDEGQLHRPEEGVRPLRPSLEREG